MFSGIIQQLGTLRFEKALGETVSKSGCRVKVLCAMAAFPNLVLGESIAINGVCLTVIGYDNEGFWVDISPETLAVAMPFFNSEHEPLPSQKVNLERAMVYGQPVGGHLVSGHVDGVGKVFRIEHKDEFRIIWFKFPDIFLPYIVPKGCVAVNGASLTINQVDDKACCFSVMLIPHTLTHTNLGHLHEGRPVNLESDLMARYVVRAHLNNNKEGLL